MAETNATRDEQNEGVRIGRRTFINTTAGLTATTLTARTARAAVGANETIRLGIIGTGGMGRHHMRTFLKQKDHPVEFVAISEIYKPKLDDAKKIAPEADVHHDYKELLDRKDIDAVIIASPEHWHCQMLKDTVAAGKDAYCEKPMSWSIQQGKEMVDAVRKTDRIVQIGMQRRSSPLVHEAKKEVVDAGVLGEVNLVRAEWYWNMKKVNTAPRSHKPDWAAFCGPAGPQKFEHVKYHYWRYFWPFSGGNMTDQGTHLMDVIQWYMNADHPDSALSWGEVYKLRPAETPDTFCAVFEYPGFMATWTLGYTNNTWRDGWAIVFQGSKASLELSEAGYRVFDKKSDWRNGLPKPAKARLLGGVTSTEPHTKNFLACVKSRRQPNATVEIGHKAVASLHLANASNKSKKRAFLSKDMNVTV